MSQHDDTDTDLDHRTAPITNPDIDPSPLDRRPIERRVADLSPVSADDFAVFLTRYPVQPSLSASPADIAARAALIHREIDSLAYRDRQDVYLGLVRTSRQNMHLDRDRMEERRAEEAAARGAPVPVRSSATLRRPAPAAQRSAASATSASSTKRTAAAPIEERELSEDELAGIAVERTRRDAARRRAAEAAAARARGVEVSGLDDIDKMFKRNPQWAKLIREDVSARALLCLKLWKLPSVASEFSDIGTLEAYVHAMADGRIQHVPDRD